MMRNITEQTAITETQVRQNMLNSPAAGKNSPVPKHVGQLLEELGQQDESQTAKMHIFLEDLTARMPTQMETFTQIKILLLELETDLGQIIQKTSTLGRLFGTLSTVTDSLGMSLSCNLHDSKPSVSSLLSELRTVVFSQVLHFETVKAQFRKHLREGFLNQHMRCLEALNQDLSVRRESVQQLVYSSRVHKGTGAENLATHRQEKVHVVNQKLWEEYATTHQKLKEALQKAVIPLSNLGFITSITTEPKLSDLDTCEPGKSPFEIFSIPAITIESH